MNVHGPFSVTNEEYTMFVFFTEDKMDYTCQKTKLIRLLEKVWSLEERIITLHEIKEGKEFINRSLDVFHRKEQTSQRNNSMVDFPN